MPLQVLGWPPLSQQLAWRPLERVRAARKGAPFGQTCVMARGQGPAQRWRIFERLVSSAPEGATVVINPDHPLLLVGPDALVAAPGVLVAILLPRAQEANRLDDVVGRAALCRLALPPLTVLASVVDGDSTSQRRAEAYAYVSDLVVRTDILRLTSQLLALARRAEPAPVAREVREAVGHRFGRVQRRRPVGRARERAQTSLVAEGPPAVRTLDQGLIFEMPRNPSSSKLRATLRRRILDAIRYDFVFEPARDPSPSMASCMSMTLSSRSMTCLPHDETRTSRSGPHSLLGWMAVS